MSFSKVTFTVKARTRRGEMVVLSGDSMALGSFNASAAIAMVTTEDTFPVWTSAQPITVKRGYPVKYRYGVASNGRISSWERVTERVLMPKHSKMSTHDVFGELSESQRRARAPGSSPPPLPRSLRQTQSANNSPIHALTSLGDEPLPSSVLSSPPHGRSLLGTSVTMAKEPASPPTAPAVVSAATGGSELVTASPPQIDIPTALSSAVGLAFAQGHDAGPGAGAGSTRSAPSTQPAVSPADFASTYSGPSTAELSAAIGSNKVMIVTYHLPVVLRRGPPDLAGGSHTWTATWDEDNIIARSRGTSLADEVSVMWCGCVTAQCLDKSSSDDVRPRRLSGDSLSSIESGAEKDSFVFSEADQAAIRKVLLPMNVFPIFANNSKHRQFGFYCNNVLSPAFHNVLETTTLSTSEFSLALVRSGFTAFKEMTAFIASEVAGSYQQGDALWVYGYELALFPQLFASMQDHTPMQVFFLSTPFPTSEVFRALSIRDDLLEGMLAANVVGFHTFNHARHFMQSCKRIAGLNFQSRKGGRLSVEHHGRDVMVAVTHVGLQTSSVQRWMESKEAAAHARHFLEAYPRRVLSVTFATCDRLSGVPLMLLAIERLVSENPVYRGKITFVVRVETPGLGPRSQASRKWSAENRELVERINKPYPRTVDYEEAVSFPPAYRVGLYYVADILMHTPVMEGLNLIPFEYVYARVHWMKMGQSESVGDVSTPSPTGPSSPPKTSQAAIEEEIALLSLGEAALPARGGSMQHSLRPRRRTGGRVRPRQTSLTYRSVKECDEPGSDEEASASDDGSVASRSPEQAALTASASMDELLSPIIATDLQAPLPARKRAGVVVLSEFATSSHAMNSHVSVNPWAVADVAKAIDQAVRMDDEERLERQWRDCHYIVQNPVWQWTRQVLTDLLSHTFDRGGELTEVEPSVRQSTSCTRTVVVGDTAGEGELSPLDLSATAAMFKHSKRRVLFLDYTSSIVSQGGSGRYIKPLYGTSGSRVLPRSLESALRELSADPNTTVCVVTELGTASLAARPIAAIDGIVLAAQDGALISYGILPDGTRKWVPNSLVPTDPSAEWKAVKTASRTIMEQYACRVSGSRIREEESAIVWSYRFADPEWGSSQANFLLEDLQSLRSATVKVVSSNDRISVCLSQLNRGELVKEVLSRTPDVDCVLCIGDESSDEDMFGVLHAMLGDPVDLFSPTASCTMTPVLGPAMPSFSLDGEVSTPADEDTELKTSRVRAVVPFLGEGEMVLDQSLTAAQRVSAISSLRDVVTICVGRRRTQARHYLRSVSAAHVLLQRLAASTYK